MRLAWATSTAEETNPRLRAQPVSVLAGEIGEVLGDGPGRPQRIRHRRAMAPVRWPHQGMTVKNFPTGNENAIDRHSPGPQCRLRVRPPFGAKGLTPYEFICKIWKKEPERFRLDPVHEMPGLNTWVQWPPSLGRSALRGLKGPWMRSARAQLRL